MPQSFAKGGVLLRTGAEPRASWCADISLLSPDSVLCIMSRPQRSQYSTADEIAAREQADLEKAIAEVCERDATTADHAPRGLG